MPYAYMYLFVLCYFIFLYYKTNEIILVLVSNPITGFATMKFKLTWLVLCDFTQKWVFCFDLRVSLFIIYLVYFVLPKSTCGMCLDCSSVTVVSRLIQSKMEVLNRRAILNLSCMADRRSVLQFVSLLFSWTHKHLFSPPDADEEGFFIVIRCMVTVFLERSY